MHPLLLGLTHELTDLVPVADDTGQAFHDVGRLIAASLTQANPAWPPVTEEPGADAFFVQVAQEGQALARQWLAAGTRMRMTRQPYPDHDAAERATEVHGPFVDTDAAMVQYSFHREAALRRVVVERRELFTTVAETVALVPRLTAENASEPGRWELPAGSVWLKADRLSPGAQGFVALRVSGGSIRATNASERGDEIVVGSRGTWACELHPEQPPAVAAGSDGEAASAQLPLSLQVHGDGIAPSVSGAVSMSVFGAEVHFDQQVGAPVAGDDGIALPFDVAGATWGIQAQRSRACSFSTEIPVPVEAGMWLLPLARGPVETASEARHGGSVVVLLGKGCTSRIPGASGACRWSQTRVSADADGVAIHARRPAGSVSLALRLWDSAFTTVESGGRLHGLRWASLRGGPDVVTLEGGRLDNQWDLPRAASGAPFAFTGEVQTLRLVAERDGVERVACLAEREPHPELVMGYAVPNAYLHVRPPGRVRFTASRQGPDNVAGAFVHGFASFRLDVRLAQPMLPDPYAANWAAAEPGRAATAEALGVRLVWRDGARPRVHSRLNEAVAWPEWTEDRVPGDLRDAAERRFRDELGLGEQHLSLLDLSGRDHQLGVRLEQTEQQPAIDDVLAWPLDRTRLLLQPQVHWEPVHIVANKETSEIDEKVSSTSHGGPTLLGAQDVRLVPVAPGGIAVSILQTIQDGHQAAALFGLPFGLHAFTRLLPDRGMPAEVEAQLQQPVFVGDRDDVLEAALFLRLVATGAGLEDPGGLERGLPGRMVQTETLAPGDPTRTNNLRSVLRTEVKDVVDTTFGDLVPLHQVDLSGHGLSTFSRWRRPLPPSSSPEVEGTGVTQVRFDVLVGRTSYEVIELQSRLWCPQPRVSRTVIIERRSSGKVQRFDSGWVPIEDGNCQRYATIDTGVVREYRNIRNIRIVDAPLVTFNSPPERTWTWQEVRYDADLYLVPDPEGAPEGQVEPIRDHVGYVQLAPVDEATLPEDTDGDSVPGAAEFAALMSAVGTPLGDRSTRPLTSAGR